MPSQRVLRPRSASTSAAPKATRLLVFLSACMILPSILLRQCRAESHHRRRCGGRIAFVTPSSSYSSSSFSFSSFVVPRRRAAVLPRSSRSSSSLRRRVSNDAAMSKNDGENERTPSSTLPPKNLETPSTPPAEPPRKKSHCVTVCTVPPPSGANRAWEALTDARRTLRDPGFYRWPPHANILYPFLELKSMRKRKGDEEDGGLFEEDMLDRLARAARDVEPFEVALERMGTFGGKNRGVLWAYPRSCYRPPRKDEEADAADEGSVESGADERDVAAATTTAAAQSAEEGKDAKDDKNEANADEGVALFCDPSEPLIRLQSLLEEQFPTCTEQRKSRTYHPHITLSHFEDLDGALEAQKRMEESWETVRYPVEEVYVLRRVGDEGQFEIAATVPLGRGETVLAQPAASPDERTEGGNERSDAPLLRPGGRRVVVHDPPISFPAMPATEEDWVSEERMKLKARRNNNSKWRGRGRKKGGRRRRNGRGSGNCSADRGPSRSTDTPEVIAAKRAERKAKREAREKQQQEEEEKRRASEEIARASGDD